MRIANKKQILMAGLTMAVAGLSGCVAMTPPAGITQTPTSERTLLIADTYFAQGHHAKAEALYGSVLRSNPGSTAAAEGLSRIAVAQGRTPAQPTRAVAAVVEAPLPELENIVTQVAASVTDEPVPIALADVSVPPPPAEEPAEIETAEVQDVTFPLAAVGESAAKKTSTAAGEEIDRSGWHSDFFIAGAGEESGLDYDLHAVVCAADPELAAAAGLIAAAETEEPVDVSDEEWLTAGDTSELADLEDLAPIDELDAVEELEAVEVVPFGEMLASSQTSSDEWQAARPVIEPAGSMDLPTGGTPAARLEVAARRLRRDSGDVSAWQVVDENLRSNDPARQSLAVLTVGELPAACNASASSRLQRTLALDPNDEVRTAAALALGGLGTAADPAVPMLREIVQTAAARPAEAARVSLLCLGYER